MRTAIEEVVALRRQNEVLSERVAYLEGQLAVVAEECPPEWKLTKSEAKLMGLLVHANGKTVKHETLITAMWDEDEPGDPHNVLATYVCKIRKKVAPFGLRIRTIHGVGFYIDHILVKAAQDVL